MRLKKVLVINIAIGVLGLVITRLYLSQISFLFARSVDGVDYQFKEMITTIYGFESLGGCIPLGINAAIISLMLGFGYTKCTLLINFCRVFVFRIPVLWGLQRFTSLGSESVGIVMLVSNTLVMLFSCMIAVIVIRKICKTHAIRFW